MTNTRTYCVTCKKKWEHCQGDSLVGWGEHQGHVWGTVDIRISGVTTDGDLAIQADGDTGYVIAPGYDKYERLPSEPKGTVNHG